MARDFLGFGLPQINPAPAQDPRQRIEALASQHQVPANVLLALQEAGADVDAEAPRLGQTLKSGAALDAALAASVKDPARAAQLLNRAYDIADELYPRQAAPEAPKAEMGLGERAGKAFVVGEASAITGGQDFMRDLGVQAEQSSAGQMLNWAKNKVWGTNATPEQRADELRAQPKTEMYDAAKKNIADVAASGFETTKLSDIDGVGGAVRFLTDNFAQSLPQMGAAIASGGFSFPLSTILLGAEANEEMKERAPDLPEDIRVKRAAGAGMVMAGFEALGLGAIFGKTGATDIARAAATGQLKTLLASRGIKGSAARVLEAGIMEGTTEAIQEGIVMGVTAASGGEYKRAEVAERLATAFAAGGTVGSALRTVTEPFAQPPREQNPGADGSGVGVGGAAPGGQPTAPGAAPNPQQPGPATPPPGAAPAAAAPPVNAADKNRALNGLFQFGQVLQGAQIEAESPEAFQMDDLIGAAMRAGATADEVDAALSGQPPEPMGPIASAAAAAPDLTPVPEVEPIQRFPDQKPGAMVRLGDPDGSRIWEGVFLRETPEGLVVRIAGQEQILTPQEFDEAISMARAADADAKAAATGKPAQTAPVANVAPPRPPVKPDSLAGQATAAIQPPAKGQPDAQTPPQGPAVTPPVAAPAPANSGGPVAQIGGSLGIGSAPTDQPAVPGGDNPVRTPAGTGVPETAPSNEVQPVAGVELTGPISEAAAFEAAAAQAKPGSVAAAAADANPTPTPAQAAAGNYKKGKAKWQGLDLTIETAKGQQRTGVDKDGEAWSVTMPANYGDIMGTVGADGDPVDFYMGDNEDSTTVWVVDQIDLATGKFDEHKVMLGMSTAVEARATYEAGFSDGKGPQRMGGIKQMPADEFKDWVLNGDTKNPVSRKMKAAEKPTASDPVPTPSQPPANVDSTSTVPTVADDPIRAKIRAALAEGTETHTTSKGKTLTGIVVDIDPNTAKTIDPYHFRKTGAKRAGIFLREAAVKDYLGADAKPAEAKKPEAAPEATIKSAREKASEGFKAGDLVIWGDKPAAVVEVKDGYVRITPDGEKTVYNADGRDLTKRTAEPAKPAETTTRFDEMSRQWDSMSSDDREQLLIEIGVQSIAGGTKLSEKFRSVIYQKWDGLTAENQQAVISRAWPVLEARAAATKAKGDKFRAALAIVGEATLDAMAARHIEIMGKEPFKKGGQRFTDLIAAGATNGEYNDAFSLDNKASRQVFEEFSGKKLPKTQRDTKAFIESGAPFTLTAPKPAAKPTPQVPPMAGMTPLGAKPAPAESLIENEPDPSRAPSDEMPKVISEQFSDELRRAKARMMDARRDGRQAKIDIAEAELRRMRANVFKAEDAALAAIAARDFTAFMEFSADFARVGSVVKDEIRKAEQRAQIAATPDPVAPPRRKFGDPDYTLDDAIADYTEARNAYEAEGMVKNARTGERMRKMKDLVDRMRAEAQAAENPAPVEPPSTPPAAAPAPAPAAKPIKGLTDAENARMAELQARFLAKMKNQTNAGLDPEMVAIAFEMAGLYVKSGVRRFRALIDSMMSDMGLTLEQAQPYARNAYASIRGDLDLAGEDVADMDTDEEVIKEVRKMRAAEAKKPAEPAGSQDVTESGNVNAGTQPATDQDSNGTTGGLGDQTIAGNRAGNGSAEGDAGGDGPDQALGAQPPEDGGATETGQRPGSDGSRGDAGAAAGNGPADGIGNANAGRQPDGDGEVASDGAGSLEALPAATRQNYRLERPEMIVGGGPKARFKRNRDAITTLADLQVDNRDPTPEELDTLAAYMGWGSFGQELFNGSWDFPRPKPEWTAENAWLRDHLGEAGWKSAQSSIINAHYTDPPTVTALWDTIRAMGFNGGRVLEPSMGIGNFFGLMPPDLAAASDLTGIELDKTTGAMAQILYPQANISIKGYEESRTADGFYDLVIGNWPFAKQSPPDRRYDRLGPSLHDYFFLKALDQTRAGGLVVGITSSGTMDKQARATRMELAKKADLVASFRLPTGAFQGYAGTAVVTDVLIFRKRETPNTEPGLEPWIETADLETLTGKIHVNRHYIANPEMVLGTLAFGSGTTQGRAGMIVNRPEGYGEMLAGLANRVPTDAYVPRVAKPEPRFVANNTTDRHNSIVRGKGKDKGFYVVQGERLVALEDLTKYRVKDAKKTARREDQIGRLVDMRRAYGALIDAEREGMADTEAKRKALRTIHTAFVKDHGPVTKAEALGYFRDVNDPSWALLKALESTDGKPARVLKESSTRSARRSENPTVRDSYVMQRNESTILDMARIAALASTTEAEAEKELREAGAVFRLPGGGYQAADVFLSGNVRNKLHAAEDAQAAGQDMTAEIAALKGAMPSSVPYFQIEARLGAPWVKPPMYRQFIAEMIGAPSSEGIDVFMAGGLWKVKMSANLRDRPEARSGYGTGYYRFDKMMTAAMGNQSVKIFTKDADGNDILWVKATEDVNGNIQRIREHFQDWVWSEAERKVSLEEYYNEVMRAVADAKFDGDFLEFPGMALMRGDSPFELRKHQRDAIWRGVVQESGLYAHEVGTGKTYTIAGIAIESRRYGRANKPLVLAHNANSASVYADAQRMYPGAKILFIDNLTPDEIPVAVRRIAADDWDMIVMPHSLIDRIGFKRETLLGFAAEEIAALEQEAMAAANDDNVSLSIADMNDPEAMKRVRSQTAKELVKARNAILSNIEKQSNRSSREGAIPFEDLGIDMILVDEAHEFKKPPIATRMKIKGLNVSPSDRSISLKFITDYVKSKRNGKGVHLFTGTPITNTLNETFNMMRYVMSEDMKRDGYEHWDAWFASFADAVTDIELTSSGDVDAVTRLSQFVNVADLRRVMGNYLDVVFADDMPEFKPRETSTGKNANAEELTDAERDEILNGRKTPETAIGRPYKVVRNEVAEMSPAQRSVLSQVGVWGREWRSAGARQRRQWMLGGAYQSPVVHDQIAAKASMDARLWDMDLPDHPNSKTNRAIANILTHYTESKDGTQVVFMETGYSDSAERTQRDGNGMAIRDPASGKTVKAIEPTVNLARELKEKLVAAGIPEGEIVIVAGGVKPERKAEIADLMNASKVRVVIGMTSTLGVGVNMQVNLRAMHHIDAPWMPGDLEQRNGRGQRQGNTWNTVFEYRYITEGIDGRRWQVLAIKDRFIKAFFKSDDTVRIIEGDALDMDEATDANSIASSLSEAAGDPRIQQRAKFKADVEKLERRERQHTGGAADASRQARYQREEGQDLAKQLAVWKPFITDLRAYLGEKKFAATIDGKEFTDRKEAAEAFAAMVTPLADKLPSSPVVIGTVQGFEVKAQKDEAGFGVNRYQYLKVTVAKGPMTQDLGTNSLPAAEMAIRGMLTRYDNGLARSQEALGAAERLTAQSLLPFGQEKTLIEKRKRLKQLEIDLILNPAPPPLWLRQSSPVQTLIYVKGKPLEVTGHRWTDTGYFIQTDKGDVSYLDAKDESGMALYEARPYSSPVVSGAARTIPVGPVTLTFTSEGSSVAYQPPENNRVFRDDYPAQQQFQAHIDRAMGAEFALAKPTTKDDVTTLQFGSKALRDAWLNEWSKQQGLPPIMGDRAAYVAPEEEAPAIPPAPRRKKTFEMRMEDDGGPAYMESRQDSPAPVATLTGDELGKWSDVAQLGRRAEAWYRDNLVGQSAVNADRGWTVKFSNVGAKKSTRGKGEDLYRIVPAIRQIVEQGRVVASEADARGRPEVKAIHKIAARVTLSGVEKDVIATIRETNEGTFHYDLSRDMSDGARFMRLGGGSAAVRMGETQVRSPALEGNPVELNLDFAPGKIKPDAPSGWGAVEAVDPITDAEIRKINVAMNVEARKTGLAGKVPVAVVRTVTAKTLFGVEKRRSEGSFGPLGIQVKAGTPQGELGVLRHEIIHALRSPQIWGQDKPYGLFDQAEWRALVKAARGDADIVAWVKRLYPDLTTEKQAEEMVAELYRKWAAGQDQKGAVRKALEKIRAFFAGLARAMRSEGFTDAAMIMERIASGKVGGRAQKSKYDFYPIEDSDMRAYHGTPHDFDKFSTGAVGTGEGAQAYGWGLYFASRREVADSYRKTLSASQRAVSIDGNRFDSGSGQKRFADKTAQQRAVSRLDQSLANGQGIEDAIRQAKNDVRAAEIGGLTSFQMESGWGNVPKLKEVLSILEGWRDAKKIDRLEGRLFTVEIPEDGDLLDWEAAVSEQPPKVAEILRKHIRKIAAPKIQKGGRLMPDAAAFEAMTGAEIYRAVADKLQSDFHNQTGGMFKGGGRRQDSRFDRYTSENLRNAGIPGHRYLDGGSRGAGAGTHNYVIYDDASIEVVDKESRFDPLAALKRTTMPTGSSRWRADKPAFWSDLLTDAMAGKDKGRYSALALVPGRALFGELGKNLMAAKAYLRGKEDMDALRNDWHVRADTVAQEWRKLRNTDPRANEALMDLMHDTTLDGLDPSKPDLWRHALGTAAERAIERDGENAPDWAHKTMAQIRSRKANYATLVERFNALPDAFQAMYRKVRNEYDTLGEVFERTVIENIETATRIAIKRAERAYRNELRRITDEGLEGAEKQAALDEAESKWASMKMRGGWGAKARMAQLRQSFESNKRKGPYFPLARFGDLFVTVRDEKGAVTSFSRFESAREQREWAADAEKDNPGRVTMGTMSNKNELKGPGDPNFTADVQKILQEAGASAEVMDAVWQKWLETLPDMSIRTNRIHRKGRAGYARDAFRAFGKQMFHGAHQLARLKYGLTLEEHLNDAEEEARRAADPVRAGLVVNEMRQRHDFAMNPKGSAILASASSLAFVWHLGLSPAAAAVNIFQTTVLAPGVFAAKFQKQGVTGAIRELTQATIDFGKGRANIEKSDRLSDDERRAVAAAERRGITTKTQAHDLASVAETGIEYSAGRERVMRAIGYMFHHTERANREITFLAGYRMGRKEGLGHEDAVNAAADMTYTVHFDYQNTARPRFMQGDIGRALTMFKQFTVNMLYRMFRDAHQMFMGATKEDRREARVQLVGITLSMMAHAGIKGTWGYALLMMLLAMFLPGDSDDLEDAIQDALLIEGDDPARAAWNWMMGAALNGVPGQVTGLALSERIGMPTMWFRGQERDMESEDLYASYVTEALGPVYGIGESIVRGASMVYNGEVQRGIETMAPKWARDPLKAIRYGTEGAETMKGDPIMESMSPWQVVAQFNGFTSAQLAERYKINNRLKNQEGRIMDERQSIHRAIGDAVMAGDPIPQSVMDDLKAFNTAYPEYPITKKTINLSIKGRQRASARNEYGIQVNPKLNDRLRAQQPQPVYQSD